MRLKNSLHRLEIDAGPGRLLLPGSLLVRPGEGSSGLALGARDLAGVGALEGIRDLVKESVAGGAVHGAARALEGLGEGHLGTGAEKGRACAEAVPAVRRHVSNCLKRNMASDVTRTVPSREGLPPALTPQLSGSKTMETHSALQSIRTTQIPPPSPLVTIIPACRCLTASDKSLYACDCQPKQDATIYATAIFPAPDGPLALSFHHRHCHRHPAMLQGNPEGNTFLA